MDLIALRDLGITIILIEHKLDVVMDCLGSRGVLDHGVKIAEGAPAQVAQRRPGDRGLPGPPATGG